MRKLLIILLLIPIFVDGQEKDNQSINQILERKDRALLFAIDLYDEFPNLNNPIEDALAIEYELKERYGFETEVITNATTDEIIRQIRNYALLKYKPFDQLLIFFAGHGTYDNVFKEGYLIGKDSELNDDTFNSFISHSRLRNVINSIPSNHTLLIIDACFSGTFNPKLVRGNPYREKSNFEFVRSKMMYISRKYLTSGGKEYVSDGIKGQHSPFARKLLEALRSNGAEDGILTMSEVYSFMEKISPTPHYGTFGDDEPGSDYLFISKGIGFEVTKSNIIVPQRNNLRTVYNSLSVDFGISSDLKNGRLFSIGVRHSFTPQFNMGIEIGKITNEFEINFDLLPGFGTASKTIKLKDNYVGVISGYRFVLLGLLFDPMIMVGTFNSHAIYQGNLSWNFYNNRLLNIGVSYRLTSYYFQKESIEFDFYGSVNRSFIGTRDYLQMVGLEVYLKIK